MPFLSFVLILAALASAASAAPAYEAQRRGPLTAPEAFTSAMQGRTDSGAMAGQIRIQIDRYTSDADRKTMAEAMQTGGFSAFVQALRKAPAVGHIEIAGQRFVVRWAREQATAKGRTISVVTDAPAYFVGGGRVDAKPREGYELAVVQLSVDDFGLGTGTMAAAARLTLDGQGSVQIQDYAAEPIKLTYVRREIA